MESTSDNLGLVAINTGSRLDTSNWKTNHWRRISRKTKLLRPFIFLAQEDSFAKKMVRYCFTSTLPSWNKQVETLYDNFDVDITSGGNNNEEEGCITLNDTDDVYNIRRTNKQLGKMRGFTEPLYTPNWKSLTGNIGPFITEEHYVQVFPTILNKVSKKTVTLSKQAELALFSYFLSPRSHQLDVQFEHSFKALTGYNLDELDLSVFNERELEIPVPADEYRYVIVDDNITNLVGYMTPFTSVIQHGEHAGKIHPGISRKDVIVNSSVTVPGFTAVLHKGASWSAKWIDKFYGHVTHVFMKFDDPSEWVDSESSASEGSEIMSEYGGESQYGEEMLTEDEDETIRIHEYPEWTEVIIEIDNYHDDTLRPDFSSLTMKEHYLPLSYIVSPAEQWRIIYNALISNFIQTSDLPKVTDKQLTIVADAISYSARHHNKIPNAAYSLLQYAIKRQV